MSETPLTNKQLAEKIKAESEQRTKDRDQFIKDKVNGLIEKHNKNAQPFGPFFGSTGNAGLSVEDAAALLAAMRAVFTATSPDENPDDTTALAFDYIREEIFEAFLDPRKQTARRAEEPTS